MENGSLDRWLHHDSTSNNGPIGSLNFLQRLNIAIDVASALHYLHDLYESSIIHCDLKQSNVLLDKDTVAHVSDFGLARNLSTMMHLRAKAAQLESRGRLDMWLQSMQWVVHCQKKGMYIALRFLRWRCSVCQECITRRTDANC